MNEQQEAMATIFIKTEVIQKEPCNDDDDDGRESHFDSSGWQVHDDVSSNENASAKVSLSSEHAWNVEDSFDVIKAPYDTMKEPDESMNAVEDTINAGDETLRNADEELEALDVIPNVLNDTMNEPNETLTLAGEAMSVPKETMNIPVENLNVPVEIEKEPPEKMNTSPETTKVPEEGMTAPARIMKVPGAQLTINPASSNMTIMLMFKCNKCCTLFQTMNLLQEHNEGRNGKCSSLEIAPDRLERCKRCHGVYSTKQLPSHTMSCKELLPFACETCGKGFRKKKDASYHHTKMHRETPAFICNKCGKEFTREGDLQQHFSIHITNEQLAANGVLQECKRCFKLVPPSTLEAHILTHKEDQPYVCDVCGKGFALFNSLRGHQKRMHSLKTLHNVQGNPEKLNKMVPENPQNQKESVPVESEDCSETLKNGLVECKTCHKTFPQKKMRDHKKTHLDNWPFSCKECGKGFAKKDYLRKHNRRFHVGERQHKCDYCGKAFVYPSQLLSHLTTHTRDKRLYHEKEPGSRNDQPKFDCKQCFKSFTEVELKTHMLTHSNEKPFICKECGQKFFSRAAVKSHCYRKHNGMNPQSVRGKSTNYRPRSSVQDRAECQKCFKSFSLIELKVHMLSHSSDEPFVCRKCGKEFTMQLALQKHRMTCSFVGSKNLQKDQDDHKECKNGISAHHDECWESEPDEPKEREENMPDKCESLKECVPDKPEESQESFPDKSTKCQESVPDEAKDRQSIPDDSKECEKGVSDKTGDCQENVLNKLERCLKCHKIFSQREMEMHMKTHLYEEPFVCKECGRVFFTNISLKMHCVRKHFVKKPDSIGGKPGERKMRIKAKKCFKCHMAFPRKELKIHMKTHKDEEPFICDRCGREFTEKDSLKNHYKYKHGEKKYKCEQCNKTFLCQSNLKAHAIIHSKGSRNLSPSERQSFVCKECGKEFEKEDYLRNHHFLAHTKDRPFRCEYCGKGFVYQFHLNSHITAHTEVKKSIHMPSSESALQLQKHFVKGKHEEGEESAKEKSKKSSMCPAQGEMRNHSKAHSDNKPFICQDCRRKFNSEMSLKMHCMRMHPQENLQRVPVKPKQSHNDDDPDKLKKCMKCHKTYPAREMKAHMTTHAAEEPFVCDKCGNKYKKYDYLRKHFKRVHMPKNHRCEYCGKPFVYECDLRYHITRVHAIESGDSSLPEANRYVCKDCGKEFPKRDYLRKHTRRVHTKERPLKCKYCGKGFLYQCELNDHKTIHTGVYIKEKAFPYRSGLTSHITKGTGEKRRLRCSYLQPIKKREHLCPICGKLFHTVAHLDGHMLIHTDIRALKCKFCSKTFKQRLSLKLHMHVHMGERPYVCAICKWSFFTVTDLKRHEKTHKGDSLLHCPECGIGFKSKFSLTIHKEVHSDPGPHNCHLCKSNFLAKRYLVEHLKRFHGKDPMDLNTKQPSTAKMKVYDDILRNSIEQDEHSAAGCLSCGNAERPPDLLDSEIPASLFTGCREDEGSLIRQIEDMGSGRAVDDGVVFSAGDDLMAQKEQNTQEISHAPEARHQELKPQVISDQTVIGSQGKNTQETTYTTMPGCEKQRNEGTAYTTLTVSGSCEGAKTELLQERNHNLEAVQSGTQGGMLMAFGKKVYVEGDVADHDIGNDFAAEALSPYVNQGTNRIENQTSRSTEGISSVSKRLTIVLNYKCHRCNCFFQSIKLLEDHLRGWNGKCRSDKNKKPAPERAPEGHLKCKKCSKWYPPEEIQAHTATHLEDRPFLCEKCGKQFQLLDYLNKHIMRHRGKKGHLCEHCGKGFYYLSSLRNHVTIHTGEKKHTCEHCGKTFRHAGTCWRHVKAHVTPFPCSKCTKIFRTKEGKKKHEKSHDYDLTCKRCGKKCVSRSGFMSHTKWHDFKDSGKLKLKPRRPSRPKVDLKPERPCEVCGKLFKTAAHLKSHMVTHTDIRGLKCDICCKTFKQRLSLKFHRRVHMGERPYVCSLCKWAFFDLSSLKKHEQTHRPSQGKAFVKCPECGIGFSSKFCLTIHLESHSEPGPHDCHLCKSTFIAKSILDNHLRKFHGSELEPSNINVSGL